MKYKKHLLTDNLLEVLIVPEEKDIPFFERVRKAEYQDGEQQKIQKILEHFCYKYAESYSPRDFGKIRKENGNYIASIPLYKNEAEE